MAITNDIPTRTVRIDMNEAMTLALAMLEPADGHALQVVEAALVLAYGNVAEGLRRGTPPPSIAEQEARLLLFARLGMRALVDVVVEIARLDADSVAARLSTATCRLT